MSHCTNCERDTPVTSDMSEAGTIVELCGVCGYKVAAGTKTPPATAPVQRTEPVSVAKASLSVPSTALDIESHLRARLAAIEVEIERAAGLKAEARKLRRMLRAAGSKR